MGDAHDHFFDSLFGTPESFGTLFPLEFPLLALTLLSANIFAWHLNLKY